MSFKNATVTWKYAKVAELIFGNTKTISDPCAYNGMEEKGDSN